jgi:hypothetical protein
VGVLAKPMPRRDGAGSCTLVMGTAACSNNSPAQPLREAEQQRQRAAAMADFLRRATLAPIRRLNG